MDMTPGRTAYWAIASCQFSVSENKLYMTRCISPPATDFLRTGLSFSDCSSWISRPDTKYKNSWTQTFDRYILFSLRTIFAQCSSSSSSTLKKWELITWNLGQIFEIKLWMVGQLHRRWVFTWADCSKNLQIENRNSFCQDWWLHGLQHRISLNSFATDCAANFDCNQFRIAPDIVSKLLRAAIWSRCTVRFESEQTPFSYRIRFGTCGFVSMSDF